MVNLLNLERVSKAYGVRPLLTNVSLGIGEGERIGIVGRNGDGKTTLLEVMTGLEPPDSGRVSQTRGLLIGYLHQGDELIDSHSVREAVLGGRSDHEWAADPRLREIVDELLAGVELDRAVLGLSGGERRRCALAALLLGDHDLVVLDEPTNHLDVEAVAWLADHLAKRASALVVVTHDRWFLDAVCQWTWEVHDGVVDAYEGGYAAFVLAKAERQRQAAASEVRRQNLVRKELAWLRRGAPARTAKPKFRIDAANTLIEDVPEPRDRLELQRFATQRLGKDVIDVEDVDLSRGPRELLSHATWRLGPGDRVGIVGVNGAGKSSVLSLLSGALPPDVGRVRHGRTVALQHLTQELDDLDPAARVLATVESIQRVTRTTEGRDVTATSMLERFGFTGDRLTARLGDLSGGERRRFQLLRLLLSEPNVLLLDEPTNDLDIETLNVLEDFLDGWPGTLVVVSHDRYFLERVTDSIWALLGDGQISMLPRGVDEYLERRRDSAIAPDVQGRGPGTVPDRAIAPDVQGRGPGTVPDRAIAPDGQGRGSGTVPDRAIAPSVQPAAPKAKPGSAEEREARKTLARLDKRLERIAVQEAELNAAIAEHAHDYTRLAELGAELNTLTAERDALEVEWLEAAELLEA
ncbi:MAG TPA: ABC-F family ATP-binding cassette domain-containing protein [Nocardioides sp.]|nr:ABC-F family ATP-binding cassette domain-containing protein [Nocardioides sp.]